MQTYITVPRLCFKQCERHVKVSEKQNYEIKNHFDFFLVHAARAVNPIFRIWFILNAQNRQPTIYSAHSPDRRNINSASFFQRCMCVL